MLTRRNVLKTSAMVAAGAVVSTIPFSAIATESEFDKVVRWIGNNVEIMSRETSFNYIPLILNDYQKQSLIKILNSPSINFFLWETDESNKSDKSILLYTYTMYMKEFTNKKISIISEDIGQTNYNRTHHAFINNSHVMINLPYCIGGEFDSKHDHVIFFPYTHLRMNCEKSIPLEDEFGVISWSTYTRSI